MCGFLSRLAGGRSTSGSRRCTTRRWALPPDSHQGVYGGWGLKAIRDTDVELVGPASFKAQQQALGSWTSMGLRAFTRQLANLPASPCRDDLLRTLTCWLDRCGL